MHSSRKRHRMSSVQRTRLEVADIIEQFLNGTGGEWDEDDFCSHRIRDLELDSVRLRCTGLRDIYPSTNKEHYCSDAGSEIMRAMVTELRGAR
jgi:hypothetical protein